MKMRLLRSMVLLVFVLVCAAAVFFNLKVKPSPSKPTIVCSVKEIKAKCSVTDEELLSYVTANDEKDGELTSKILVENVTQFIEEGVSMVNYCVEDSDKNVSKKSVRLVYTDYEKPEFVLKDDLVFANGTSPNFTGAAKVTDKFDGDITGRLYTIYENEKANTASSVLFKVTNSKGYTYEWRFKTVSIPPDEIGNIYKIKLSEYVIHLPLNSRKPDFKSFIKGAYYNEKPMKNSNIVVDDSELTTGYNGTYDVWFRLYVGKGKAKKLVATERLIVVCGGDEE